MNQFCEPLQLVANPIVWNSFQLLQGLRILVVDDDQDTVDLAATILEYHGATMILASSAIQALAQWEQQHPDVLISDLAMPEQDGYWLLEKIQQRSQFAPIWTIAWTACSRVQEKERALSLGYQKFLEKPVEPDTLVNAVARLTGRL
jgi:CheY-like chemotaxis protein